jgi:hypothetical protein
MNWRAESTGDLLPLSRPATQLAEIMAKVVPCGFRLRYCPGVFDWHVAAVLLVLWAISYVAFWVFMLFKPVKGDY